MGVATQEIVAIDPGPDQNYIRLGFKSTFALNKEDQARQVAEDQSKDG